VFRIIVLFFIVLSGVMFNACSEPTHPDADRLCNCYTQMYRANHDALERITDSCNIIHMEILERFKDDSEEKEKFNAAYAVCQ